MNCGTIFLIFSTICGVYIGILMQKTVLSLCELEKCPACYGTNLCNEIRDDKINLIYTSFTDLFYNLLSVKNLYFADYEGVKVVLKKLGYKNELTPSTKQDIVKFMIKGTSIDNLKICNEDTAFLLLEKMSVMYDLDQIWTIIKTNVEPLILNIFKNEEDWPIPKLYGACGLLIVEKYCGRPLNNFETSTWDERAFLALQLLEAAVNFTRKHPDFRLYLTDISPDNIVVDDDFNLFFVDLENAILTQKQTDNDTVHYSRHFDEDGFVYSEDEVCQNSISDHNVYAVCKLLLSERAPWPMMKNGLLHSPPARVKFDELFHLIEECVDSKDKLDRFDVADDLIQLLKAMLQMR